MTRKLLLALAIVAVAAVCVRLGFWQLSRWHGKQRLNAALRSALASPPLDLAPPLPALESVRLRRVRASGVYDERRQFVLSARAHQGSPGVDVVTPLVIAPGQAVLVDRGWLYAADAATANPLVHPVPGPRAVVGLPQALPPLRARWPLHRLAYADSASVWATFGLDPDTLAARLPYRVAPWMLRALPGPDAPGQPLRSAPEPFDEMMHLSYAIQWFTFATILVVGSLAVAIARSRGAMGAATIVPPPPRPGDSP